MITYRKQLFCDFQWNVYLDGKKAGEIRHGQEGYIYFPNEHKEGGLPYPTLSECKKSLED